MNNWFTDQIEWLKSFLSDPNGKGSSKRGISIATVVVFLTAYLKLALVKTELMDIPPTWAVIILGVLGLGIYSNTKEVKTNGNGSSTTPPIVPPTTTN